MVADLLYSITDRASVLWLALALTIAFGWPFGWALKLDRPTRALHKFVRALGHRLNKAKRNAATLAWRGVIVTGFIVLPAMLLGRLIDLHLPSRFMFLAPLVLFIASQRQPGMIALWRAARSDKLTLQMAQPHYIFADTHALLRFVILDHATRFAIGIIGVIFWYLIAGSPGAFGYLALGLCAAHFSPELERNLAFGGATDRLFSFIDAGPRTIATALLLFAGFFAPGAKPLKAARHVFHWRLFLATLLGIALGGDMPAAHGKAKIEWVGSGTPKPDASHLSRWLLIWGVALLVVMAVLLPSLIQLKS